MTTPGLAGFIATGEDSQTRDVVVAEVLEALGQSFELLPERAASRGGRRRTWFDTFDWRLYKAGLTLEYAAAHRGGELRLTGASPYGDAVQLVTGWKDPARTSSGTCRTGRSRPASAASSRRAPCSPR